MRIPTQPGILRLADCARFSQDKLDTDSSLAMRRMASARSVEIDTCSIFGQAATSSGASMESVMIRRVSASALHNPGGGVVGKNPMGDAGGNAFRAFVHNRLRCIAERAAGIDDVVENKTSGDRLRRQ